MVVKNANNFFKIISLFSFYKLLIIIILFHVDCLFYGVRCNDEIETIIHLFCRMQNY